MTIELNGEERIPAPVQAVWQAINDPGALKICIPGCETLDLTSPTEMTAVVVVRIGPVKARFTGAITLGNIDAPHGYTITGEGKGGVAGFAKGGADVALSPDGADATVLRYTVNANVGGKLAQLGGRLIVSTAQKLAAEFFANLNRHISGLQDAPSA